MSVNGAKMRALGLSPRVSVPESGRGGGPSTGANEKGGKSGEGASQKQGEESLKGKRD